MLVRKSGDELIVVQNGKEYNIVYMADFEISKTVMPYGIVFPGDDFVTFLSKPKAKRIWKKLKPAVDNFLSEARINKFLESNNLKENLGLDVGDDIDFIKTFGSFLRTLGYKDLDFEYEGVYFHNPFESGLMNSKTDEIENFIDSYGYDSFDFEIGASFIKFPEG